MITVLQYYPGQTATIFLEVLDGYGRADPDTLPLITRVILPGFTLATGYPQPMTRIDVGLYYALFTLPVGGYAVGSYLIDVSYRDPISIDGYPDGYFANTALYQIVVTAPFGNFSTTLGC
jgi:hypothetical protein